MLRREGNGAALVGPLERADMPQIEVVITRGTIVGGQAVEPGAKVLVSAAEAALLLRMGKATLAEPAVVVEEASAPPDGETATAPKRKRG